MRWIAPIATRLADAATDRLMRNHDERIRQIVGYLSAAVEYEPLRINAADMTSGSENHVRTTGSRWIQVPSGVILIPIRHPYGKRGVSRIEVYCRHEGAGTLSADLYRCTRTAATVVASASKVTSAAANADLSITPTTPAKSAEATSWCVVVDSTTATNLTVFDAEVYF